MITQSSNYTQYITLLIDILTKGGEISEGVVLSAEQEINVKLSLIDGGCKLDFLAPEPKAKVTRFITLSDKIDYIKILSDGKFILKIRGWAWEIPVEI